MATNKGKKGKYRIWGSVPWEEGERLEYWAKKLGIPKTALVAMCVHAGLNYVIRSIEPDQAFTPEQWAKIVREVTKTQEDDVK